MNLAISSFGPLFLLTLYRITPCEFIYPSSCAAVVMIQGHTARGLSEHTVTMTVPSDFRAKEREQRHVTT